MPPEAFMTFAMDDPCTDGDKIPVTARPTRDV